MTTTATKPGVLLIFPPNNLLRVLGRGQAFVTASAPLGVLTIAAVLEEEGIPVEFLDAFSLGWGVEEVVRAVKEKNPRLLGISCLTSDATVTREICRRLRAESPQTKILLGNHHPREYIDYFLGEDLCHFICTGEGEYTTVELYRVLSEGGDLGDVAGLAWRDDQGRITVNPERPLIADLDQLPMPARHLAPMERYRIAFYFAGGRSEGLITARGCPNRCAFCTVHGGIRPRYRSPELMVAELDILFRKYGYKHAFFYDPLFMGRKSRVMEFCQRLVAGRRRYHWSCEANVNFVTPKLLKAMAAAGCRSLSFGIESGVPRLLKRVNKKQSLERIAEAVRMTKEAGIKVSGLFILGLPDETRRDSLATIDFALKLPLDFAQFSIFTPYPGSPLFYELKDQGLIDPMNWEQYSAYPSFGDIPQVYTPAGRTYDDVQRYQRLAIRKYYLRPIQIWREMQKLRPDNLLEVMKGLWAFIRM